MSVLEARALRSGRDFLVMSDDERTEYESWREERAPYRDGSAQQRAFVEGMRRQARLTADPWQALGADGQEEHRQTCHALCKVCEAHRAFGACTSCGSETEATGPDELSRCCGSRAILRAEDPWSER
jgi:hypothetical protein